MPTRKKGPAFNATMLSVAFVLIVFGAGAQALGLGASVINTVNIGNGSYACSTSGCTITASFTNNNYTLASPSLVEFGIVKNSAGQEIVIDEQQVQIPAGGTQAITFSVGSLAAGSYTALFLAETSSNVGLSEEYTFPFTTGTAQIQINGDPTNGITYTVSPAPTSSVAGSQPGSVLATFPDNTQVQVTYTNGGTTTSLNCQNFDSGVNSYPGGTCTMTASGTQVIAFTATTADEEYGIYPSEAPLGSQLGIPVFPETTSSIATITPGLTTVYPSDAGAAYPSTATFSVTPSGSVTGWALVDSTGDSLALTGGTTSSTTVSYSQAQQANALGDDGDDQLTLEATINTNVLTVLAPTSGVPSGFSVTPSPGSYVESAGQQVQLSVTPSISGSECFGGWLVGSSIASYDPSYSVTVNGPTTVTPVFITCPAVYLSTALGSESDALTITPAAGTYYFFPGGSGTFTATETTAAGFCFNGWLLNGVLNTTAASITVKESGDSDIYLVATSAAIVGGACNTGDTLVVSGDTAYPSGVTTSPAPGTYLESYGASVSLTATVTTGYCWGGWYKDGVLFSAQQSVSVTMPSQTQQQAGNGIVNMDATVTPVPTDGKCPTPSLPGSSSSSPSLSGISWVGIGSIGFGVVLAAGSFLPAARRR